MYINAHSYYSLRYGTYSIDDLLTDAKAGGIEVISLTDINNSTGTIEFYNACIKHGIKPIAGMEVKNGDEHLFTGIAKNKAGFAELNRYVSHFHLKKEEYDITKASFSNVFKVYRFGTKQPGQLKENEFIGIGPNELSKLLFQPKASFSKYTMHPTVSYKDRQGYELHKMLRAVSHNTLYNKLTSKQISSGSHFMRGANELLKLYGNFPQIIANTEQLIAECSFEFDGTDSKNKKTYTGSVYGDIQKLRDLAVDGMVKRYGQGHEKAKQRLEKELGIIEQMGFCAYFLITWDIIQYSKSKGYYHVGRGSGANSIVAYCLYITDVCPLELNLYFERFLNPSRTSAPDFDLDFSWKERDDVLEYIFRTYGPNHTALLGTMSTFKDSSIVRELGKIHGLPKAEIDILVEYPQSPDNRDRIKQEILRCSAQLQDYPNLRSIHAGGVLISEEPIFNYSALDLPPKGFPTVQWDMYAAERIGYEKFDILSQRGIGHIKDAVQIIKQNKGVEVDVHDMATILNDPKLQDNLQVGNTLGCFYIESPAMKSVLRKLNCRTYLLLTAASSIIRPGVGSSGMMDQFIERHNDPAKVQYLHPVLEEHLGETYGVMVYQEDVMIVCYHYAGLSLAKSDKLRRAMSGKYRSSLAFQELVDEFFACALQLGRPEDTTKELWRQISSFAGYSFCKAHSASFAVESFQSLTLKTYFPREFMVAVINNFGGFYRTWVYVEEAKKAGAIIHLPHVNISEELATIHGDDLYLGFIFIKSIKGSTTESILAERKRGGEYKDLDDFMARVKIEREQLLLLIRIGAFRFTGKTKQQLMWHVYMMMETSTTPQVNDMLFELPPDDYTLPKLKSTLLHDAHDELNLLGFTVSMSLFDMLQTPYRGNATAATLKQKSGQTVRILGNLVTAKYIQARNNTTMTLSNFLDLNGEFFDAVNFGESLKKYPFTGSGVYLIEGVVKSSFGSPSVIVDKMAKLPLKPDPRY